MQRILSEVRGYAGLLELAPPTGSEYPEVSWGDHFFYYAPDGEVPRNRQPYATIVTKDYPGDAESRLGAPDRWRLNVNVGRTGFAETLGYATHEIDLSTVDLGATDVFIPHPLYGAYGWLAVVNPAGSTTKAALEALREAHIADRQRVERRRRRATPS